MRRLLTIGTLAWGLAAQTMAPGRYAAANFAADIEGEADTRPGTWGKAGVAEWRITFRPPAGYRVRVLRAYGDLVSWARGRVPEGTYAGVLMGLQTTAPDGSQTADWLADNCFLYVQDVVGREGKRSPFDAKTDVLLEADHVLRVKVAAWLNDTGLPIHMEPTFVVVYRFEEDEAGTSATIGGGEISRPQRFSRR
ncbi:MAG: hypothetical protein ACE141_19400 [Bryobacteraceae bacterium]